jgi:hypothetical protein
MAHRIKHPETADDVMSLLQMAPHSTVAVFSVDAEQGTLVPTRVLGPAAPRLRDLTIDIGYHVSGWVAANWVPMVNADAQLDLDVRTGDLRYALSMPLIADYRLSGVLTLYSAEPFGDAILHRVESVMPSLAASLHECDAMPPVAIPVDRSPAYSDQATAF